MENGGRWRWRCSSPPAAGAATPPNGESWSPRPGEDVLVSQDRNPIIARNSPVLAVNPTQRTNMVVVDRVDRPDYTAGVHVTNNGGGNWQDVALKLPAGSRGKLFAPSAAYDGKGMLYVSYVTLSGPGNSPDSYWVARSGDGGLNFDEPTKIAGAHTFQTSLAVDPKSGRLFAAWLQSKPEATMCILCFAQTGLPIVVSRSDDGGRTWSPPAQVSDAGRMRVGAPALAVDDDGNPAVLYLDYGNDRLGLGEPARHLRRQVQPGAGPLRRPGPALGAGPGGRRRHGAARPLPRLPAGEPRRSPSVRNGDMYAVWADGRSGDADVLLRRSTDDGKTWSKPVQVNRGTAGDGVPQDMPSVGVAPGGRVDVVYYDRTIDRRGSTADVLLSSSSNSGKSFSKTIRLSDAVVQPQGRPRGLAVLPGGRLRHPHRRGLAARRRDRGVDRHPQRHPRHRQAGHLLRLGAAGRQVVGRPGLPAAGRLRRAARRRRRHPVRPVPARPEEGPAAGGARRRRAHRPAAAAPPLVPSPGQV